MGCTRGGRHRPWRGGGEHRCWRKPAGGVPGARHCARCSLAPSPGHGVKAALGWFSLQHRLGLLEGFQFEQTPYLQILHLRSRTLLTFHITLLKKMPEMWPHVCRTIRITGAQRNRPAAEAELIERLHAMEDVEGEARRLGDLCPRPQLGER